MGLSGGKCGPGPWAAYPGVASVSRPVEGSSRPKISILEPTKGGCILFISVHKISPYSEKSKEHRIPRHKQASPLPCSTLN